MKRDVPGTYRAESNFRAFVPDPLPPQPPVTLDGGLGTLLGEASFALGRLDGISSQIHMPNAKLLLYMYLRKEAVLSSQIEGTKSSLSELLLFEIEEAPGMPVDDVQEVSNYVAALYHGLHRLQEDEFPLSSRLIREIHGKLLASGRGHNKAPGEFRRTQVWIGGTGPDNADFVPPPHVDIPDCMTAFERFLHAEDDNLHPLVRTGLAHVQFETIHPFLDGNGRVGRMLIALMLCDYGLLLKPLLYPSLYFKQERSTYYDRLDNVRQTGDWEAWLEFFLTGVKEAAESAVSTAELLADQFQKDQDQIRTVAARRANSALRVHAALKERVILSVPAASHHTGLTFPTADSALALLAENGIVREVTGKKRNRRFVYQKGLDLLNADTETP